MTTALSPAGPTTRTLPLLALRRGQQATVVSVSDELGEAAARRLFDLGFGAGTRVQCLRRSPFGSPVVYAVGETDLCLRADLAGAVLVELTA
ncbi:MAG: ferrous iron transport protein A [Actinobacteria bacterium]|nr:ferrous iron transport protein A [Actinomycetota bacterium]MCG2803504.1 ferrous iron transport protein A [Cellulomonas sp.]